ncbi:MULTISPECIES: hypothetical protein [unclassified Staphylococcus]|uniref:hypothetical protein n=1 Tax=unclassified Staphylococcus TaxID=91994 RepID=UPI00194FE26A|nr:MULTISPECIES: hypothetical protein [unclassified Staphylococcus]
MKTYHELFSELEYWDNYQPKNFSSSILKQGKLNDTKNQILQQIDFISNKEAILKILNSSH